MSQKGTLKEKRSKRDLAEKRKHKSAKIFKGVFRNMLKHVYLLFRYYFEMVVDLIFSLLWEGEKKQVPPLEEKHAVLMESAVTLAKKIRNKELKSADLVLACIERIKQVNPIVNAVTDERFEDALKDAQEVDRKIETGLFEESFKNKPFLGIPFTTKDSTAVSGMLHSLGLASRRQTKATADAECVRLLRAAGAIPVALTNVPEVNKWQETRNMVFGQTNNPYHTGRTAGGSSGGEAALSASVASPISLCSDIGGSTRMPAFYCGLYALNPTAGYTNLRGLALRTGTHPSMASVGFVSRHLEDLVPLTKVVLGDKAAELDLDRPVDVKNIKIYYTETAQDLRVSPICPSLRKAMKKVIAKLSETASSTDRAPAKYYHAAFNHMFALWRHEMTKEVDCFAKLLTNNRGEAKALVELGKKLVGVSQYTLAAIFMLISDQILPPVSKEWGDKTIQELKDDLAQHLGEDGVLLFPSAPQPAPYHYALLSRPFNFAYWAVLNAIHFPAIQIPLGLDENGLPLGIQVVAAPKQEALCLAVAKHISDTLGGFVPPCDAVKG